MGSVQMRNSRSCKLSFPVLKNDIGTVLFNRSQKMKNYNKGQQQHKLVNILYFLLCRKMIWPLENLQSKATLLSCISYYELSSLFLTVESKPEFAVSSWLIKEARIFIHQFLLLPTKVTAVLLLRSNRRERAAT